MDGDLKLGDCHAAPTYRRTYRRSVPQQHYDSANLTSEIDDLPRIHQMNDGEREVHLHFERYWIAFKILQFTNMVGQASHLPSLA